MLDLTKKPNRGGRPTKLTDALQARIVALVAEGNYLSVAAACGVGRRTLFEWLRRGEAEPAGRYGRFRRAVLGAEQSAETAMVKRVTDAAKDDVRAAM